ncbi:RHS repeat domain-containing protein [Bdellovibrio reynosensis]|uniref:RHS repeat protein n=1 Tax=Bdellovibrio reynosensis TaxID=2835041 RepID=A0ABY4C694_9BACT|nr:RHS repeat domain-containing protein [Bdellovibrio reynosensis]UOF00503.1 RHS repeat protein [Bdellovibrio reynosensis]
MAHIDTISGSFIQSFNDFTESRLDLDVNHVRTYNSRSTFSGGFGEGWCTDLDLSISENNGHLLLRYCGDGKEVVFKKEGSVFLAKDFRDGRIHKENQSYVRTLIDGTTERYQGGKLKSITGPDTIRNLRFIYSKMNQLEKIQDGSGRSLLFERNKDHLITKISFKSNRNLEQKVIAIFEYSNAKLVSSMNFEGERYHYFYDGKNKLNKVIWPDKGWISLTYHPTTGWVSDLKGTDICSENFDYKLRTEGNPIAYNVDVTKTCIGKAPIKTTYTYKYSADYSQLNSMTVKNGEGTSEYLLNNSEEPIEIIKTLGKDVFKTSIKRNEYGQTVEVSSPYKKTSFSYSRGKAGHLVSQVDYESFLNGVSSEKGGYKFTYDKEGRLASATPLDKTSILFSYDAQGRLSKTRQGNIEVEHFYEGDSKDAKELIVEGKKIPNILDESQLGLKYRTQIELSREYDLVMNLAQPNY